MNKIRTKKFNRNVFIIVMLAFPMLHVLLFSIYVNIDTVIMAFQKIDYESNTLQWAGFENFAYFFQQLTYNDTWVKAILNSLYYFPVTNFIILPLSLIFSYFIFRRIPLSKFYVIVYFMPSLISIVVLGGVFKNILSPQGPIASILINLFHVAPEDIPLFFIDPKYATASVYAYSVWVGLGYNIVLFYGAMNRIPQEIMESGRLSGVSMMRELFQIITPIIWPTITTLFIFGTMGIFTVYTPQMIMTPGGIGDTWTIAYLLFNYVSAGSEYYYAAAIGIMVVLVGVPIVQLAKFGMEKCFESVEV